MPGPTPTAAALAAALRRRTGEDQLLLLRPVMVLLARGEPVGIEQIAIATGRSAEAVRSALAATGGVEYDEDGRLVGLGLTLRPTPHRFEVEGKTLFTWCAVDALAFPSLLHAPACVQSPCPATGQLIRVEVLPDRVLDVDPPGAVVSIVVPLDDDTSSIRTSFCDQVSFFSSAEAAEPWLAAHPGGALFPIAEAYALAHSLTEDILRA